MWCTCCNTISLAKNKFHRAPTFPFHLSLTLVPLAIPSPMASDSLQRPPHRRSLLARPSALPANDNRSHHPPRRRPLPNADIYRELERCRENGAMTRASYDFFFPDLIGLLHRQKYFRLTQGSQFIWFQKSRL